MCMCIQSEMKDSILGREKALCAAIAFLIVHDFSARSIILWEISKCSSTVFI